MTSGLFCALAMTAALMIFTRPLLTMLGATHEIIESSLVYVGIIFLGTPAFFMMMVFNNLVRGEGNTRLSMLSMAISSGVNIAPVSYTHLLPVYHEGAGNIADTEILRKLLITVEQDGHRVARILHETLDL